MKTNAWIQLETPPIATGTERSVFFHPDDNDKLVKVATGTRNRQNPRDIDFYQRLARRGQNNFSHIPNYFGAVTTNLGPGIIVETIRDNSGEISRSMRSYLLDGMPLGDFSADLATLKRYLLDEIIIFNYDMLPHNLLYQQRGNGETRLVAIDGLGDVVKFQFLNYFAGHARAKIERRWKRMIGKIETRWAT